MAIIMSGGTEVKAYQQIGIDSVGTLFTLGLIPFLPYTGVRWMQVFGFVMTTFMSLVLGLVWCEFATNPFKGSSDVLLVLYCFLYGSYWVTNVTTYVMSALVFKPSIRSTLNGVSAAAGKVGAILGTTIFTNMLDSCANAAAAQSDCENKQVHNIMLICTAMGALGLLTTIFGVGVEPGPVGDRLCTLSRGSVEARQAKARAAAQAS